VEVAVAERLPEELDRKAGHLYFLPSHQPVAAVVALLLLQEQIQAVLPVVLEDLAEAEAAVKAVPLYLAETVIRHPQAHHKVTLVDLVERRIVKVVAVAVLMTPEHHTLLMVMAVMVV